MIRLGHTVMAALALSLSIPASYCKDATDRNHSGIIYGQGYAFMLAAPPGWVMDTDSGASDGAKAVFYPHGSSWNGRTVMYAQVGTKDDPTYQTLPRIVQSTLSEMKTDAPRLVVRSGPTLTVDSGQRVITKYLTGTPDHTWQAVAFIDQRGFFTELVLSAKTQTLFRTSLPKFRRLISSYHTLNMRGTPGRSVTPESP